MHVPHYKLAGSSTSWLRDSVHKTFAHTLPPICCSVSSLKLFAQLIMIIRLHIFLMKLGFHVLPCAFWWLPQPPNITFNTSPPNFIKPTSFILAKLTLCSLVMLYQSKYSAMEACESGNIVVSSLQSKSGTSILTFFVIW